MVNGRAVIVAAMPVGLGVAAGYLTGVAREHALVLSFMRANPEGIGGVVRPPLLFAARDMLVGAALGTAVGAGLHLLRAARHRLRTSRRGATSRHNL